MQPFVTLLNWLSFYEITNEIHTLNPPNARPIIGVLAQEITPRMKSVYRNFDYTAHIPASYVKFVESGGARVAPILINQNEQYYRKLFAGINGALFPGGSTWFNGTGMEKAAKVIWDMAREANDKGDYFPIWGTCLGFELLMYLEGSEIENRESCSCRDEVLNLKFTSEADSSEMMKSADNFIVDTLVAGNVTYNFHHFCYSVKGFRKTGLDKNYKILSTSVGKDGFEFVSAVESRRYPFFGVQFHPEKNLFEWNTEEQIPHSLEASLITQYFSSFLAEKAKQSTHKFSSAEEEWKSLIYNYNPTFTLQDGFTFDQCYFF